MPGDDSIKDQQLLVGETGKSALIAGEGDPGMGLRVKLLERCFQGFSHDCTEMDAPGFGDASGSSERGGRKGDCRADLL